MNAVISPVLLKELKELIVESLKLEDLDPADIGDDAPLVGEEDGGLGLDSIDFLELAMAIERRWSVKAQAGDSDNERIYRTVGSLAAYIQKKNPISTRA
jgi:acyl carrier protein